MIFLEDLCKVTLLELFVRILSNGPHRERFPTPLSHSFQIKSFAVDCVPRIKMLYEHVYHARIGRERAPEARKMMTQLGTSAARTAR